MWGETLEWEGGPLEWDGGPLEWEGETLEWDGGDPRMGRGTPRTGGGGRFNPKIGFRTRFWYWYQFFTIRTNIGLFGLKLSAFILIFRHDSNGSTPEGPRPLI